MQLSATILITLASSAAIANYNISMYQHRNCFFKVGKSCPNMKARECCRGDGNKFKSAKFVEVGGGRSTDQLKLYMDMGCGDAAVLQKPGNGCLSHKTREIQSSAVYVVFKNANGDIVEGTEEAMAPVKMVEPTESFMEEGKFKYSVKRDSPEGREYDKLKRVEDQVDYLKDFGRREEIPEDPEE